MDVHGQELDGSVLRDHYSPAWYTCRSYKVLIVWAGGQKIYHCEEGLSGLQKEESISISQFKVTSSEADILILKG